MDVVRALFVTLAVLVAVYVARWWTALSRSRSLPPGALERAAATGLIHTAIGFITNFFDTLRSAVEERRTLAAARAAAPAGA